MFSQLKRMESQCQGALQSSKSALICKCTFDYKCCTECSYCHNSKQSTASCCCQGFGCCGDKCNRVGDVCKCAGGETCQCDKECDCAHCKQIKQSVAKCCGDKCKCCADKCKCAGGEACQCGKECECAHCKQMKQAAGECKCCGEASTCCSN